MRRWPGSPVRRSPTRWRHPPPRPPPRRRGGARRRWPPSSGATSGSTTSRVGPKSRTPSSTGCCASSWPWRRRIRSSRGRTPRRAESAARRRMASRRWCTRGRCFRSRTRIPGRRRRPGWRGHSACSGSRREASWWSSRSTACPSRSDTRTACSRAARRGATGSAATTSPTTSGRSGRSRSRYRRPRPWRCAERSTTPRPRSNASTPSARRRASRSSPTPATPRRGRCGCSTRGSPEGGGWTRGSTGSRRRRRCRPASQRRSSG